jgi:hypothetical protein
MKKSDISQIEELREKIEDGTATQAEKDEYVEILHKTNSLDKFLYETYKNNEFVDNIMKTCIIIGGIIVTGTRINELLKKEQKEQEA